MIDPFVVPKDPRALQIFEPSVATQ